MTETHFYYDAAVVRLEDHLICEPDQTQQIAAGPELLGRFLPGLFRRRLQKFGSLNVQYLCQLSDYFQTYERSALFNLAHVGPIHAGLVGQLLLGQAFSVSKTTQVGGEKLAEIHSPAKPDVIY